MCAGALWNVVDARYSLTNNDTCGLSAYVGGFFFSLLSRGALHSSHVNARVRCRRVCTMTWDSEIRYTVRLGV